MDDRDNIFYLKSFVKQHPDNRMAWYLLGKQYEEQGKEAKANYCYLQAGEIYEAFERKTHPLVSIEEELQQLKQWQEKKRARSMKRRAVLTAVLLLLLAIAVPASPGSGTGEGPDRQEQEQEAAEQPEPENGDGQDEDSSREKQESTVVLAGLREAAPLGSSWEKVVYSGNQYRLVLAAQLENKENWRLWLGETRLLMSAQSDETSGKREVELYDAASCACEPAPAEDMEKLLKQWSGEQETKWTLGSAILAYRSKNGEWPASIKDLVRPYPDNIIAGVTPAMEEQFEPLLDELQEQQDGMAEAVPEKSSADAAGTASASSPTSANPAADDLLNPLEIIVDKSTHQLAVVSGDIIIRSYTVGLGGERTPEGEFVISEKVKNPNGTDKGPYGSRGMVLSDSSYAIHGTDEPDSIGQDDSQGCVRMSREDLEELYDFVPLGTKVSIKKGVIPPDAAAEPDNRFQLAQGQDETNPGKVYKWLN